MFLLLREMSAHIPTCYFVFILYYLNSLSVTSVNYVVVCKAFTFTIFERAHVFNTFSAWNTQYCVDRSIPVGCTLVYRCFTLNKLFSLNWLWSWELSTRPSTCSRLTLQDTLRCQIYGWTDWHKRCVLT